MSDSDKEAQNPSPLERSDQADDFNSRLTKAKIEARLDDESLKKEGAPDASGLGQAYKIAIELVAAVGVGALIGITLDDLFGAKPWLLVVFFFFGFAAGVRNMMRSALK